MQQFSAAVFMYISRCLADLRSSLEPMDGGYRLTPENGWTPGTGPFQLIAQIKEHCQKLGLFISERCADELLHSATTTGLSVKETKASLVELDNTIRREMSTRWVFQLSPDDAIMYSQRELFGPSVNTHFPSIIFDMTEAGNCYALGRGTACVFHLMRIMEVGVQKLGSHLGVVLVNEKSWQNILDEVNKAIRKLPPKASQAVELSQVAAHLFSVKLAWRNEVMHPKEIYTLEEAEALIRQVKAFMMHLSTLI